MEKLQLNLNSIEKFSNLSTIKITLNESIFVIYLLVRFSKINELSILRRIQLYITLSVVFDTGVMRGAFQGAHVVLQKDHPLIMLSQKGINANLPLATAKNWIL